MIERQVDAADLAAEGVGDDLFGGLIRVLADARPAFGDAFDVALGRLLRRFAGEIGKRRDQLVDAATEIKAAEAPHICCGSRHRERCRERANDEPHCVPPLGGSFLNGSFALGSGFARIMALMTFSMVSTCPSSNSSILLTSVCARSDF